MSLPGGAWIVGVGAFLTLAASVQLRHVPRARVPLVLAWTWLWAELLAMWWVPHPGEPPQHTLASHRVTERITLPGDIGRPPDPQARRTVAVVGDSFTVGQGAPLEASLPARLREALAPEGVDVRNLGARGSEFWDQSTRYALLDRELEPDVVIWAFVLNDLEIDYDRHDAISVRWSLKAEGPTPLLGALRRTTTALTAGQDISQQYRTAFDPSSTRYDAFTDWFRRLVTATHDRGARFVLVLWPLLHRLDDYPFADIHAQLAALGEDAGAEVVDLLEVFKGRDERTLWAHPFDHHPNAEGYALAAEAVLRQLRSRPIPDSQPWRCDGPTLLAPPRDTWERAWCAERTPDTLRAHAIALHADHRTWLEKHSYGAMIGRVPRMLLATALARRAPDAPEREEDLALYESWAP